MVRRWIIEVIAALYILLFTYAAVSKLLDYEKFKVEVSKSPLLTEFGDWIVWGIPLCEITISVMLAVFSLRLLALYASFGLMVMFTGYIIAITEFSDYIPCSCGGILENMSWRQHLIFNIAFLLLALLGILLYKKSTNQTFIAIKSGAAENLEKE